MSKKKWRSRSALGAILSLGAWCGAAAAEVPAAAAAPSITNGTGYTFSSGVTVPGSSTNTSDSPAVGGICYVSGEGTSDGPCGAGVMWRNAATNAVDYRISEVANLATWDPLQSVPSARTSATPAFQNYPDSFSNYGPFVAWKGQGTNQQIWYSADTISWSPQKTIPGASTTSGPAVFMPFYYYVMFVAWAGTNGDVYYSWGNPAVTAGVDTFTWTKPATIPNALTDATPAVAEITTGPDSGRMYVFWKGKSASTLWYSWIADPYVSSNKWAPQAELTNDAPRTSAGPAASESPTANAIVVAYRGQSGSSVWYETLNSSLVWSAQSSVPGVSTTAGPGLASGVMAATQSSGSIKAYTF